MQALQEYLSKVKLANLLFCIKLKRYCKSLAFRNINFCHPYQGFAIKGRVFNAGCNKQVFFNS